MNIYIFLCVCLQVHRKYTGEDFDEDLRTVLRRSGCKNEKIAFIMDESNVLDSGFLERMNTLLANGEVTCCHFDLLSLTTTRYQHNIIGIWINYLLSSLTPKMLCCLFFVGSWPV